ncbi:MAG: TonB-dependent receptor plug domain-containing protein [Candidatus Cloacimonadaceae bacterium]|nr:TonB-dependent receptor plug domain-containing protein [Candidatus Cloacimonadaceae bacterium]MDP3114444.1 TonB-dependent receptor plug domain-containing protein [Candidatus Cloacimonadaceae bacterium]
MLRSLLVLLLLCAILSLGALGQSVPVSDSLSPRRYLLSTVRVIASSPTDAISSVKVIEPDAASGAITLYEVLQGIPGIGNTVGSKEESNLRIRGFRRSEVKLMVNGRPLSNGYFGNVDLGNFGAEGIADIQLIRGPASAIFGNNSMGGVVNLITSDPDNKSLANLSFTTRRNNATRVAISSSRRFSRFSYRVSAARNNSDGIVLSENFAPTVFENGGVRNNQQKTQWNLDGELYFEPDAFHRIGATGGIGYIGLKRLASSVYEARYRQLKDWKRYHGTLMWEGILSGSVGTGAMIYYDGGGDRYQEFNDPGFEFLAMDSVMRSHSLGFSPHLQWRAGEDSEIQFGLRLESKYSTRRDNGYYLDWTPHNLNSYNAFAQWQTRVNDSFGISSGIGISAWNSDVRDRMGVFAEPSIAFNFKHLGGAESNLSLGRNTSFPTMRQLFADDRGNPALKPQNAWKAEIFHFQPLGEGKPRAALETSLFINEITNLIDIYDGRFENIHAVRSYGGELGILLAPLPNWECRMDYARLEYSSRSDFRLTESPRNSFAFETRIPIPLKIWLKTQSSWTDLRYSQNSTFIYQSLHSYWKHDLSLSRKWSGIHVSAGLENILDADYETEYGYPAPGRDFYLKVSVDI